MDKKKTIGQEVEKILQCFDQPERIKSNPFFFTRVQAAILSLEREQAEPGIYSILERLLRPAIITAIVALNVITAGIFLGHKGQQEFSKTKVISTFAEEYFFTQHDYDIFKTNNLL